MNLLLINLPRILSCEYANALFMTYSSFFCYFYWFFFFFWCGDSFFNGIPIFAGYIMPSHSCRRTVSSGSINLINSRRDERVNIFRKGICLKMNMTVWLGFELASYIFAVQYFIHNTTWTPPGSKWCLSDCWHSNGLYFYADKIRILKPGKPFLKPDIYLSIYLSIKC